MVCVCVCGGGGGGGGTLGRGVTDTDSTDEHTGWFASLYPTQRIV